MKSDFRTVGLLDLELITQRVKTELERLDHYCPEGLGKRLLRKLWVGILGVPENRQKGL